MENKERILKLLENDATLTAAQVAVMLDEDENEVAKAIKEYEKNGIINGYKTLINWDRTSIQKASALIELKVTPQRNTGFDEIAARIMSFPEVESVYLMSGGFDLAVLVNAKSMQDIAMFVAKDLHLSAVFFQRLHTLYSQDTRMPVLFMTKSTKKLMREEAT